jgi:Mn-containing catalase
MSQGEGDQRGSWNQGEQWEYIEDRNQQCAVDGGMGDASVNLSGDQMSVVKQAAMRTASNPQADPTTGAELGASQDSAAMQRPGQEAQPSGKPLH